MSTAHQVTLDDILCDPDLANQFDLRSQQLVRQSQSFDSFRFRWGALKLRKKASSARIRGQSLEPKRFCDPEFIRQIDFRRYNDAPALYRIYSQGSTLYIGEALRLRTRLMNQFAETVCAFLINQGGPNVEFSYFEANGASASDLIAYQAKLAAKHKPSLNLRELWKA
jgi:hypothetical protein